MTDDTIHELLKAIEEKRGPYSRDVLTHAENCINSFSEKAKKIREQLIARIKPMIREAENHEIYDVKAGLYRLLKDLGVAVKQDEWGDYSIEE